MDKNVQLNMIHLSKNPFYDNAKKMKFTDPFVKQYSQDHFVEFRLKL
jgi:hypothetical protein